MTKGQAIKLVEKAGHRLPEDPILQKVTKQVCSCGAELSMLGSSFKFFPSYLVCPACGTVRLMPGGGFPNTQKFSREELKIE